MQRTPRRQGRPRAARTPARTRASTAAAAAATDTPTSAYMPATPSTASSRHTANAVMPSPGRGTHGHRLDDGRWFCDCKPPREAVLRETRKPGPNKGRWFYTCVQTDRRRQCKFFLWEDFAKSSNGAAAPTSSFRTSIGRRTTPEAERNRPLPPTPTPTPLARQRRQPQPQRLQQPSPLTASRQRIFTTPTSSRPAAAAAAAAADSDSDSDSDQEPPPTPTPRPRRRDTPPQPASHTITHYFRSAAAGLGSGPATDASPPPPPAVPPSSLQSPSYSDDGFDSDMERGCVALADHIERENWRVQEEEGDGDSGDGGVIKHEATGPQKADAHTEEHPAAEAAKMDVDPAVGSSSRPNSIVVPTPAPPLPSTPSRRRRGPELLVARDQRPAAADTSFATSFATSVATSFASSAAADATAATAATATSTPLSSLPSSIGIKREAADDGDQDEKHYDNDDPFFSSTKKRRTAADAGPRDSPAAFAVLSLLADQPLDAHVRRRLRYMLNGLFAADNEPPDSPQ